MNISVSVTYSEPYVSGFSLNTLYILVPSSKVQWPLHDSQLLSFEIGLLFLFFSHGNALLIPDDSIS